MNMPGFTAQASLYKIRKIGSESGDLVRRFELCEGSVYLAFLRATSCEVLCPPCEAAGGICIHERHGCFCY